MSYPHPAQALRSERGNALILVLMAVVLLGVLSATAFAVVRRMHEVGRIDLSLRGQTLSVAESGLAEALSWYRKQPRQPVVEFKGDVHQAGPPRLANSLVREFEVSGAGRLWGRYEVRPDTVLDVTEARGRGRAGSGRVWEVTSEGTLYIRNDANVAYNLPPNEVLYRLRVSTELQRLAMRPPARAAILTDNGKAVTIGAGGRVRGTSGSWIVYRARTGRPDIDKTAEVSSESGAPMRTAPSGPPLPPFDLGEVAVFGVRPQELRDMSDIVVTDVSDLPAVLPQVGLVYIDGDAVFNEARALVGGGVLYVNGNLTIERNSNASFFGIVYVAGDLEMNAPAVFSGTTIVRGLTTIRGKGDITELTYNEDILAVVRRTLGQYRIRRAVTRAYKVGKTG